MEQARTGDVPAAEQSEPHVLLILAHPDDETMIGGLLGRLKERRIKVSAVVTTRGEQGKVVKGIGPEGLIEEQPRSPQSLARRRTREMKRAARFHGLHQVRWLSSVEHPLFKDGWPRGGRGAAEGEWSAPLLKARLAKIIKQVRPTLVITLNPDASHTHPQHQAIGKAVLSLFKESPDLSSASLYGIREQDWHQASATREPGDLRLLRGDWSSVLGHTYQGWMAKGTTFYRSQSAHRDHHQALTAAGKMPAYAPHDVLKRLDTGHRDGGLEALLGHHSPRHTLRSRCSPGRLWRCARRRLQR